MAEPVVITNGNLAAIVSMILTQPFSGEVDDQAQFEAFCTDIAEVLCKYCGGEVVAPAAYAPEATEMAWPMHYRLKVVANNSSPEGGGIWAAKAKWSKSSVPVKYWDCYHSEFPTTNTHQFDLDDQRSSNGQLYVDLGGLNGHMDDLLGITVEVNTSPLNGVDHVPCAHVHFDGDNLAVSLFKIGDRILMRPETNVSIDAVRQVAFGVPETMFWIDSPNIHSADDDEQHQRRIERDNQNKRNIFVEAMQATYLSTSVSVPEKIRIRRDVVAQEVLGTYPADTVITREMYDADGMFGECLNWMHQQFEFPNWEGRTVGDFLHKHEIAGEPVCMNVLQHSASKTNKDGLLADNITLQELLDAQPLGEDGWLLPSGLELWFHAANQKAA